MSRTALVTGAGGFIGRDLCARLSARGWRLRVLARDAGDVDCPQGAPITLTLASPADAWAQALEGVDCVFHLAGIAHRRAEADELRRVNELAPAQLFSAASRAGVGAFVWLSTIKVLGDTSARPLMENDSYAPADPYALSKARGERHLLEQSGGGSTRLAIVRPPIVYGPGVKANFRLLLGLAAAAGRGVPLPLGGATAPRSILGLSNLGDFLLRLTSTGAGVLHVADAEDFGVAGLLTTLVQSTGHRARLWRVEPRVVRSVLRLLGQQGVYQRLFEPLQIDQRASNAATGWRPPLASSRLLGETMAWYL